MMPIYESESRTDEELGPGADEIDDEEPTGGGDDDD